jgi:hypothetical protein
MQLFGRLFLNLTVLRLRQSNGSAIAQTGVMEGEQANRVTLLRRDITTGSRKLSGNKGGIRCHTHLPAFIRLEVAQGCFHACFACCLLHLGQSTRL